jgi:hypothetical protein
MLKLIIEDRIKRFDLRFINPHMDTNNNNDILYAQGEKGMFAKGPELKMEILPSQSLVRGEEASILRVNVYKGKKTTFKDEGSLVAVPTAI